MIVNCILWILSIVIDGIILFFTGLYYKWYFDLIGILCIPILYLILCFIVLVYLFITSLIMKAKKDKSKPSKYAYWMTYQINYILCRFTSWIKVINKDIVPTKERFVLVFNHRSNWDPMVLMSVFRKYKMYFITKPQNLNIPVAGSHMERAGFIPINRENNKEGLKSVLKAIDIIKQDKGSIGVAPEGTRNKTLETTMLDFHAGTFKIAYKAQAPIVVTTLRGCEIIRKRFPLKTRITINVLKVIPYEEYKDKDTVQLSNEIYKMMEDDLKKEA